MTLSELKPYEDKTVVLHLKDGEIATVKIVYADAEYGDIIVDILTTTRPQQYKGPQNSLYTIPVAEIETLQPS